MEEALADDPALAIGTAKEMVETVCKTILAEWGRDIEGNPDVPQLVKQTMVELSASRDNVGDKVVGADTVRKMQ